MLWEQYSSNFRYDNHPYSQQVCKNMVNRPGSLNSSLTLKVVGIVCILSFFIDFAILLLGFSPSNVEWIVNLTTSLVDRGIVPLVGLGMLFAAFWIDKADGNNNRPQGIDLKLPSVIISIFLGALFIGTFGLHLININQLKEQKIEEISQKTSQAETQLKNQLAQIQSQLDTPQGKARQEEVRTQLKAQLTATLHDNQKYNDALNNPRLPQNLKDLLKTAKANPKDIDKLVAQRTDPQTAGDQQLQLIRSQRDQAINEAQNFALTSGLRIAFTSLVLCISFAIIGGVGLKDMGDSKNNRRKDLVR
jgi:thiol:disulfide interchange protein